MAKNKYTLVNDSTGEELSLDGNTEKAALFDAISQLGWTLVDPSGDEVDDESEEDSLDDHDFDDMANLSEENDE